MRHETGSRCKNYGGTPNTYTQSQSRTATYRLTGPYKGVMISYNTPVILFYCTVIILYYPDSYYKMLKDINIDSKSETVHNMHEITTV